MLPLHESVTKLSISFTLDTAADLLHVVRLQLEGSEFAQAYQLLLLFAYGTWSDYKGARLAPAFCSSTLQLHMPSNFVDLITYLFVYVYRSLDVGDAQQPASNSLMAQCYVSVQPAPARCPR